VIHNFDLEGGNGIYGQREKFSPEIEAEIESLKTSEAMKRIKDVDVKPLDGGEMLMRNIASAAFAILLFPCWFLNCWQIIRIRTIRVFTAFGRAIEQQT
jgi:hypothetical protein